VSGELQILAAVNLGKCLERIR